MGNKRRRPRHQAPKSPVGKEDPKKGKIALLCVALAVVTIAAYWPVLGAEFVRYDDNVYVTENQHVLGGLTLDGVKWAFSTGAYAANWHPLTWLSHMLDCELFGENAGLHHLTNLLLHTAASVLLLLLLASMTGRVWPSAFVAAAFALHPLHVESVAWIAERKDVLSGLFWVMTMACYLRYARTKNKGSYALTLVVFGLGLMAKPMLVTLPFVLLLVDYWPLKRLESDPTFSRFQKVRSLIVEKIPFFIFTGVSCIITFMVQKTGGAVRTIEFVSYGGRVANAAVSYMAYIVKMVWPTGLAVLYPFKHIPVWQAIGAFLILVIITVIAALWYRKQKYFLVGWLWYIGTLVPVIGLVQVGGQSHADRYTYIPLIGLFIIAAWAVADFCRSSKALPLISSAVAILLVAGMFAGTRNQVDYWKDSISLFGHAIDVTKDNHVMHNNLGNALVKKRQYDVAITHFRRALKINPDYSQAHNNLALALAQTGLLDEAIIHFRRALKINPDYADAHNNLGFALVKVGQLDGAISQYHRSLQINPNHPEAHYNLALALAKTGQLDEAAVHYRRALKINPAHTDAYNKLGLLNAERGQLNEAIGYYRQAVQINPTFAKAHNNLAFALTQTGQFDTAIDHYRKVLKLKPEYPAALNNLAWILATTADPALRNPVEAVALAEKMRDLMGQNAGVLDTLAVAYASDGRFDEAVSTAEKALELAKETSDEAFVQEIEDRVKLFKEGQSYIEKPASKDKPLG